MPVYNGEKYIGEAIGSILAQTERDFELLVVDDGSTDKTVEVVSSFKDDRVKYFKRSHEGLVMALNFALGKANSKYIARMDADDVAYPERFEKQLKYITANNLAVCGSWADLTDEDGDKIGELKFPPITAGAIRYYAILHNPFIHPTVIFDRCNHGGSVTGLAGPGFPSQRPGLLVERDHQDRSATLHDHSVLPDQRAAGVPPEGTLAAELIKRLHPDAFARGQLPAGQLTHAAEGVDEFAVDGCGGSRTIAILDLVMSGRIFLTPERRPLEGIETENDVLIVAPPCNNHSVAMNHRRSPRGAVGPGR